MMLRSVLTIVGVGKIIHVERSAPRPGTSRHGAFQRRVLDGALEADGEPPFVDRGAAHPAMLNPMIPIFVFPEAPAAAMWKWRAIRATDVICRPSAPRPS